MHPVLLQMMGATMELTYSEIRFKKKRLLPAGRVEIPERALTVIKGKNGTGKTLLLRSIFLRRSKEHGDIVYVDQTSNSMIDHISTEDNIWMGPSSNGDAFEREWLIEQRFGHLLSHQSTELSGGEKRLLSILRGFFSGASWIILDEPTNELDHAKVQLLLSLILRHRETKTIICISHDDRIDEMADQILEIKDQTLCLVKSFSTHDVSSSNQSNKTLSHRKDFLQRLFHRRFISLVSVLLFLASAVFAMEYMNRLKSRQVPLMETNQLDVFLPTSSLAVLPQEGAIPIGFFRWVSNSTPIRDSMNQYILALQDTNQRGITYGLYVPSDPTWVWYPLELYDVRSQTAFFLPERYLQSVHETSLSIDRLESSNYFWFPQASSNPFEAPEFNVYLLDINRYWEVYSQLLEDSSVDDMKFQHIILSLDEGHSFFDWIESDHFTSIAAGNYLLRSNETIAMYNAIQSMTTIQTVGWLLGLTFGFCLILEILFDFLYFKEFKRTLSIIVNQGVRERQLKCVVRKMYQQPIERAGVTGILALYTILRFTIAATNNTIWGIWLFFVMGLWILELASVWIRMAMIKRHYQWRYR